MRITVLVGNPRAGSRTQAAAQHFAAALVRALGLPGAPLRVVDLAGYGAGILDWEDGGITALAAEVAASDLVLVASPTYKATFAGILKAFLDRTAPDAWAGTVAVMLMTGGTARHALAPEVSLRPLLVELGATVPCRGLFVLADELGQLDTAVASWLDTHAARLRQALGPGLHACPGP